MSKSLSSDSPNKNKTENRFEFARRARASLCVCAMNNLLPEVLRGSDGADNPFGDPGDVGASSESEPVATSTTIQISENDEGVVGAEKDEAKRRWQAGIELAVVESKKGTQWVPDNDMVEFFRTITSIDDDMRGMEEEIVKLEALHVKSKITTSLTILKDMRESMASHIQSASRTSKSILNRFGEIENTRKAKLSALSAHKLRMRTTIFNAKRKQFKKVMSKFSGLRLTVQEDYKEIVIRRYKTVTGEAPTDDEVTEMIETGESETIFQKAILEQGRGQIQDTLNEIDERHRAVQEIERGLLELQQTFIDLATVVDQQSEVLDNIEVHVNTASEFTAEGAKALQLSAGLHKSIQRKKLCILILVVIGLAILAAILYPIINNIVNDTNRSANTKAIRRQAAADEARNKLEQENRDRADRIATSGPSSAPP